VGGAWGLAEGLRSPVGSNAKLRVNAVLNACTRRGPLVGNSAGVASTTLVSSNLVLL
jgi:import inner membrane translocase subunit TIM23